MYQKSKYHLLKLTGFNISHTIKDLGMVNKIQMYVSFLIFVGVFYPHFNKMAFLVPALCLYSRPGR